MGERHSRRLRLRLLGPASWATDPQSQGVLTGHFAPLAAYVALNGRVARDTMARLLWGVDDLERARSNLRQHVRRLRFASKHRFFEQGDSIELASGVDCDVLEQPAAWPLADLVACGDFLAGVEVPGHLTINTWIAQQRRHWYGVVCDMMISRATEVSASPLLASAIQYACRVTELTPGLESGWRARMWLHYLAGDRASAVDAHARLAQRLGGVGTVPSAQTQELWAIVRRVSETPSRLLGNQPGLTRPPLRVGRNAQWAAMDGARSLGRPVLLRGEGGIGKTRLLGDFVHHLGAAVLVHARKGDQDSPYATLGTLLRALIHSYRPELDAATLRLIGSVLRELERPRGLAPADKFAIWHCAEHLVNQAALQGLKAIAVDNVHHADQASIEAFVRLASGSGVERPYLALAARPLGDDARAKVLTDWQAESPPLQAIDLPPLEQSEVAELLESLELVGPPAEVTAAALFSHVGGNPLLLLETLRELVHLGPDRTPIALPKPSTVLPLMARRLLSVRPTTLPLLQLGAVLDADIGQASAALGHNDAEIAVMSQELQAQGIVRDGGIMHDLMRETVLAQLTPDERRHWYGTAAGLLTPDLRVPRSRVAALWETAERWPEAGVAFCAAGNHASDAGRLIDARSLFHRSAECFRRAADEVGQFDALFDSFNVELDLFGTDAAQALVNTLQALAATLEQSARAAIAAGKVAISRHDHTGQALVATSRALELCAGFEHLRSLALSVQALGLAQASRFDEAVKYGREALALERAAGPTQLSREIAANLVYAYFAANRLGEAIELARPLVEDLESSGDHASAGSMEGNLATLLQLAGDPAASIGPSMRSLQRHREIEPTASGPLAVTHRATLGAALAYVGRFGEALEVLNEGGAALRDRLSPLMGAKLRLTIAHVWLLLGAEANAVLALGSHDDSWPVSAQVRRDAALADAARIAGRDGEAPLRRIREAQAAMTGVSLMHMPWIEWSRQGDPAAAAGRLQELHDQLQHDGRLGAARTAQLRRIDRLSEIDTIEAIQTAVACAAELQASLDQGLMAQIYLPEAWCILAKAFERAGRPSAASDCLGHAQDWVNDRALPNVPQGWRERASCIATW